MPAGQNRVCIVRDCPNSVIGPKDEDIAFFCLPLIYRDRIQWEKFSGRNFKVFPEHAVFCQRHFPPESIVKVGTKTKLLKHSCPTLHPPPNVTQANILKEITRKGIKKVHDEISDEVPMPISPIPRDSYDLNLVLNIFKGQAQSPWGYVENDQKFYFHKIELPPDVGITDDPNVLPLLPCPGECLVIDKNEGGKMTLIRRGEKIALRYIAPLDFDQDHHRVYSKSPHVLNFIKRLKNRRDPVPIVSERLQFHAHSLQTLGTRNESNLGSALTFLSNQLFNWIDKCTEYHKLPHFVPSTIRMALLARNQSRTAYATLRDCDQLILPSETVLAPFNLIRAPQGLTNDKYQSLIKLHETLDPIDRFVSLVIDDSPLKPKLNFDSQGMIIGHAINDTIDNQDESEQNPKVTSTDALASKIFCFMVQGFAQKSLQHVVATYPVLNASIDFLKQTLLEVLSSLHQAGFQVLNVISNNSITNRKIYRLMTRKTDDGLENDPVMKHPYDPSLNLILTFDPLGLLQSIRNDFFRREEFDLESGSGCISWVLLASLKDHQEGLSASQRKAKSLHGPLGGLLKSQKLEKNIPLITQLFSSEISQALKFYSDENKDLWPSDDINATCDFLDHMRQFLFIMNIHQEKSDDQIDQDKCDKLQDCAKYVRNIAIPSGVLVKSTGQAIVQICNANIQLAKICNEKQISPFCAKRLHKSNFWLQKVEHELHRDNKSRINSGSQFRIPDDVLPPRSIPNSSGTSIPSPAQVLASEGPKKRGRKRKVEPKVESVESAKLIQGAKILVLEDGQQVLNLTSEEAKELGIHQLSST